MDEINYGEVFGLEIGEEVTEPAEPSESADTQGEEVQEAADPAVEEGSEESAGEESAENTAQTPETNAKYAAARRRAEAERDAAIAKAREEAQAEAQRTIDAAFASMGMVNPYTGKPITNKSEFDEYQAKHSSEKKKEMINELGISATEFNTFIDSLPEVREAKAAKAQADAAAKIAADTAARAKIDEQIREISAIDPTIKSLEDFRNMETYDRFYDLVKKGNTLLDAYKLANIDKLTQSAAAASRQAALNATAGKGHLNPTKQHGTGAVPVPADIKAMYRQLNPDATDAEILKHYNSTLT